MGTSNIKIQLLRSTTVYDNFNVAKEALTTQLQKDIIGDGEIVTASYKQTEGNTAQIHTLFGIKRQTNEGNGISYFRDIEASEDQIQALIDKMSLTEVGGEGKFIKSVKQENGKVTAVAEDLIAEKVLLNEIGESDIIKLTANNVQEGIAELFKKIIEGEEVTAKTAKCFVNVLGDSSYKSDTGDIVYVKNETDTILGNATSFTDADNKLSQAIQNAQQSIQNMDVDEIGEEGKFIKSVSQTDGLISAELGDVNAGDVKLKTITETEGTKPVSLQAQNAQDGFQELFHKIIEGEKVAAQSIKSVIDVLGPSSVNVDTGEIGYIGSENEIIKNASSFTEADMKLAQSIQTLQANAAQYKLVKLSDTEVTALQDNNVKEAYKVVSVRGETETQVGDTIKIYKDGNLKSAKLSKDTEGNDTQKLILTYTKADGNDDVVEVDFANIAFNAEFKNGLQVAENGEISVKVDTTSEGAENFLSVDEGGVKVSGVQEAINTAKEAAIADAQTKIEALDVETIGEEGKFIQSVSQSDGKISATFDTVKAKDVTLDLIQDSEQVQLDATTVQDGIAELFKKIIEGEEVTANTAKCFVNVLGDSSYKSDTGDIVYVKNETDTILGNATSFTDADNKLSSAITDLKNKVVEDELVTSKSIKGVIDILGENSINIDNGVMGYVSTQNSILKNATSFSDADMKLAQAIIALQNNKRLECGTF